VKKTSRVIMAHEDMLSWGYGAEIAARIGDELFHDLDAPVRRVAAMDTFVAYQPLLENEILPQPEDLYKAMAELAAFLDNFSQANAFEQTYGAADGEPVASQRRSSWGF
jgi:2-oxoisovalerate dehydrogenase E1 component